MSISTHSVFYKTIIVDETNNFVNIDEGGGELTGTISSGSYSLTDILTAVKTTLDTIGTNTYTVTVDRTNRRVTIAADGAFDILLSTGSQVGISIWNDLGFTQSADLTGLLTYQGASGASSEYIPQFVLQDYVPADNWKQKISPTVNESASGQIEVVSFGERSFYEMSFKFITNKPMDGKVIKNNPSGVDDLRAFMDNAIQKGPMEFMPDVDNRGIFTKVLLESTPSDKSGTGYKLKELFSQNLPDFFELNGIKFRVI